MKLAFILILIVVTVPFGAAKSQGVLTAPNTAAVGSTPQATNNNNNGCAMVIGATLDGVLVANCVSVPPGGKCSLFGAIPVDTALIGHKIKWVSVDLPPCLPRQGSQTTTITA